jgi:hypothetical protein
LTDRAELRRLHLRVERALIAQRHLRSLALEAEATLATLRRDLRNAKARLARAIPAATRSIAKERHA